MCFSHVRIFIEIYILLLFVLIHLFSYYSVIIMIIIIYCWAGSKKLMRPRKITGANHKMCSYMISNVLLLLLLKMINIIE